MNNQNKRQLRDRRIEIRLTEDEYLHIKRQSEVFGSVGHYIRSAIREFSDINARQRLEQLNALGDFYQTYRNDLSHISGNLNQSVKRINELAVAGLLTPSHISQILMPSIDSTRNSLEAQQRQLKKVTSLVIRQTLKGG